jgi:hypothetical protein
VARLGRRRGIEQEVRQLGELQLPAIEYFLVAQQDAQFRVDQGGGPVWMASPDHSRPGQSRPGRDHDAVRDAAAHHRGIGQFQVELGEQPRRDQQVGERIRRIVGLFAGDGVRTDLPLRLPVADGEPGPAIGAPVPVRQRELEAVAPAGGDQDPAPGDRVRFVVRTGLG